MQYTIQVKHLSVEGGCFWQNSTVLKRRCETSKRNGREEEGKRRGEDMMMRAAGKNSWEWRNALVLNFEWTELKCKSKWVINYPQEMKFSTRKCWIILKGQGLVICSSVELQTQKQVDLCYRDIEKVTILHRWVTWNHKSAWKALLPQNFWVVSKCLHDLWEVPLNL